MRKTLFIAMVCLLASAVVVGEDKYQPLNIKTGQWQVTETYKSNEMPAPHTITFKSCVTKEGLASNPFNDREQQCEWHVVNSNGTDMELKATACSLDPKMPMQAAVHFKLHAVDSEHVNGSGDWTMTGNGMDMKGNATGSGSGPVRPARTSNQLPGCRR
jgi:Protein of unknown function (DUF3617)